MEKNVDDHGSTQKKKIEKRKKIKSQQFWSLQKKIMDVFVKKIKR